MKVGSLNVACDGGKGHLGHPTVYLNLEEKGEVVCPYCSKKYIFDKSQAEHAAH
ncbi:MAG: zinc-finger domain-containing protein [Rhodospirillales bacterium]|nr:zinc-finger domain-containing protein [Rhodospirillales bacterium]